MASVPADAPEPTVPRDRPMVTWDKIEYVGLMMIGALSIALSIGTIALNIMTLRVLGWHP